MGQDQSLHLQAAQGTGVKTGVGIGNLAEHECGAGENGISSSQDWAKYIRKTDSGRQMNRRPESIVIERTYLFQTLVDH
jgi:hypothetical protein